MPRITAEQKQAERPNETPAEKRAAYESEHPIRQLHRESGPWRNTKTGRKFVPERYARVPSITETRVPPGPKVYGGNDLQVSIAPGTHREQDFY